MSASISRALPAGLTFSSTDGSISGLTTAPDSAPVSHTVTARDSGGTTATTISE